MHPRPPAATLPMPTGGTTRCGGSSISASSSRRRDSSLDDGDSNSDGVVVSIQGVGEVTVVEEVQFVEMTREKKMMEGEKFRVYM